MSTIYYLLPHSAPTRVILRQGFAWQRSALQLGRCGGGTQRVPGPLRTSPMLGVWGGFAAPNPHPKCKVGLKHALVWNDRNRFDLNQKIITKEPANLHGRTGRWLLRVDVLIAYCTHNCDLGDIEQEVGQFHDMAEARSNRSQGSVEIFEDLCRLCLQVIQPDHVAGSVQCYLPRDIDRPASTRFNHVAKAKRLRHRRRVLQPGHD